MFDDGAQGIMYITLMIFTPLLPVYNDLFFHHGGLDLYASLIVSSLVILYEYLGLFRIPKVSKCLWFERLLGILIAAVEIVYAGLNILLFIYNKTTPLKYNIDEYIISSLLLIYFVIAMIELIKVLYDDYHRQTIIPNGIEVHIIKGGNKV